MPFCVGFVILLVDLWFSFEMKKNHEIFDHIFLFNCAFLTTVIMSSWGN